jgi:hypothetical protein
VAVVRGKPAADEHLPIREQQNMPAPTIESLADIEAPVEAAIRIQPSDPGTRNAVVVFEIPRDNNLAILLNCEPKDKWIDIPIDSTGDNVRGSGAWIERRIQGTVGIKTRDQTARRAGYLLEIPSDHDLAICLERHVPHPIARLCKEALVDRAIAIQARHITAVLPVEAGKVSANKDFPVRLRECLFDNSAARARTRVETGVQYASRVPKRRQHPSADDEVRKLSQSHLVRIVAWVSRLTSAEPVLRNAE